VGALEGKGFVLESKSLSSFPVDRENSRGRRDYGSREDRERLRSGIWKGPYVVGVDANGIQGPYWRE
jgi:hypothetical protein